VVAGLVTGNSIVNPDEMFANNGIQLLVTLMCAGNPDCSLEPITIAAEQALQKLRAK
jgi:hypothetical protein